MDSATGLETRLAEALKPIPDPEPELDQWLLSFSEDQEKNNKDVSTSLENRLAEAEKPVDDPQPELEDWLLNFSENLLP